MIWKISEILIILFPLTNLYSQFSSNILHLSTNTDLVIMSSTDIGKVGIANEYPEALLDVNGSVKIRDKLDLTQHKISNVGKIQFSNLIEGYEYDSGYSTGNIYSYSFAYQPAGVSNGSKASLDDGQFAGFWTNTSPNNVFLDFDYFTALNGINQTNIKITGIKVFLDGYATDSNVSISQCQLYERLGTSINLKGQNKCATPVNLPTSEQYLEWGNENDDWGTGGIDLSDIGIRFKFDYSVSPSTAYIDSIQMRVYYTYENSWNLKQNATGYFDINFTTNNIVSISTNGIFNVNGSYYLNGQPFSAGDNLGNHIATMTLTANYGINASSINITGIGVSETNPLLRIAGSTMVVLNNGNVGIGTSNPLYKLEVQGDVSVDTINIRKGYLNLETGNGTPNIIYMYTGFTNEYPFYIKHQTNSDTYFYSFTGNALTIKKDNSIGISTTQTNGYGLFVDTITKINNNLDVNGDVNITGNYLKNGSPIGGSGDAVLSATQTWTGINTYNNNTIFNSSITITGTNVSGSNPLLSIANSTMVVLNNGYVGIGTTNPSFKFDIRGNSAGIGIKEVGAYDTVKLLTFSEDTNDEFFFESGFSGIGSTGNTLKLKTYWGNYAMTWRGDGNVGIGMTNPQASLSINANPNQQYALVIDTNNNPSDGYVVSVTTQGKLNAFGSIRARRNSSYTMPAGGGKIPIDTVDFNSRSDIFVFDNNNNRIKVNIPGYYKVSAQIALVSPGDALIRIMKNGSENSRGNRTTLSSGYLYLVVSDIIYLTPSDYIELSCYIQNSSALEIAFYNNYISLLGPF
jgi:hypothetical protein